MFLHHAKTGVEYWLAPICLIAGLGLTTAASALELLTPVACSLGKDCAIQQYVDRQPGPDALDYRCGEQTYDGHNGTDFRLPDLAAMEKGVAVLAAADGEVARIRDGVADRLYRPGDVDVAERECGNGVLIDHREGWTTQYCHMKLGSIAVAPGDQIKAGARIGEVGLSGQTIFPHLHLVVRRGEEIVDPFRPEPMASEAEACRGGNAEFASLWKKDGSETLGYRDPHILNVGFADASITMEEVESGTLAERRLDALSPALVFFGRAIGIRKGDRQRLTLTAPDGTVVAQDETEPADRAKAQLFAYAGKKRPPAGWQPGTYVGRYAILRDGAEVGSREGRLEIR